MDTVGKEIPMKWFTMSFTVIFQKICLAEFLPSSKNYNQPRVRIWRECLKKKLKCLWSQRIKLGQIDGKYMKGFFFFTYYSHLQLELFRNNLQYLMRQYFPNNGSFRKKLLDSFSGILKEKCTHPLGGCFRCFSDHLQTMKSWKTFLNSKTFHKGFSDPFDYPVTSLILCVMPFSPHSGPFCSPELYSAPVFLCLFIPLQLLSPALSASPNLPTNILAFTAS